MAKETLASTVSEEDIIDLGEEENAPNFLIDENYGGLGRYGDIALVERKIAYRTGKPEDGVNEGKVIRYIKWTNVEPHTYGRTIFDVLNNYDKYVSHIKFKQLNKSQNFDDVKQIYLDTQATIRQALKSSQFTDDIKQQGTLLNEIADLKSKLKSINSVLEEAEELRELIKSKRRIIVGETEPKKHRTPKEEE